MSISWKVLFYRLFLTILFAAPVIGIGRVVLYDQLIRPRVELREGDIIFQTSRSAQSQAIQLATHSPYSHMGLLLKTDQGLQVFEAGKSVRFTRFDRWVRRGKGWKYVVKRLARAEALLTPAALQKMEGIARTYAGQPYDLYFEWSDERLYCSELVWKIYQRTLGLEIGKLKTLKKFDLSSPAVKAKLDERYHGKLPLSEKVISPKDMFDSELLVTVKK